MMADEPLLAVRDLVRDFAPARFFLRRGTAVRAVDRVSFTVAAGESLGLVGESGSGKTTTARCVLRLIEPTSGQVRFRGRDLLALGAGDLRRARRDMQAIFQDPVTSLNPRMTAAAIVEEPLVIHRLGNRDERRARVSELFDLVALEPALSRRRAHELSGGQRQRLCVARALALSPSLVVADEPVSSLDVSVQAQVINLLQDLQERLHLAYLFIAHDLRLVRHVCARVAVMHRGRIVEMAPTASLFDQPAHPYTRALLSAIPVADPDCTRQRIEWEEESVDPRAELRAIDEGHWARV